MRKEKKLKSPVLMVDGIILEKNQLLMIKRAIYPFSGFWVLPGGHVDYGERTEEAVRREVKEELGIEVRIKKLVGVYSDPKRDPRYHTVSIAYLCQKVKGRIKLNHESSQFKYFPLGKLPQKIGFDHRQIIRDLRKSI